MYIRILNLKKADEASISLKANEWAVRELWEHPAVKGALAELVKFIKAQEERGNLIFSGTLPWRFAGHVCVYGRGSINVYGNVLNAAVDEVEKFVAFVYGYSRETRLLRNEVDIRPLRNKVWKRSCALVYMLSKDIRLLMTMPSSSVVFDIRYVRCVPIPIHLYST